MRFSLLANLAALLVFVALAVCFGVCRWEVLVFQLVLQVLTNEFWVDVVMLPFKGMHLFGPEGVCSLAPRRVRRVVRWLSPFLLLFPAGVLLALGCMNAWGEGALGHALRVPMGEGLVVPVLAAQGVLFVASLVGGLLPLSYRTVLDALMARREVPQSVGVAAPASPPPAHAGVEMLPHALPEGVVLPGCLRAPQRCSSLHARHVELVRERLREGELAVLSTAPAGVVPLPSSSNERLFGGLGLCLAVLLLYMAVGLFEEEASHVLTRWVVVLLGLGLLPVSVRVLRAAAHRQVLLLQTDYVLTNRRLHVCRAGTWSAVSLVSVEVVPGGMYGEGRGDVELCPESGSETCTMVNVEFAEEWCALLERLVALESAR